MHARSSIPTQSALQESVPRFRRVTGSGWANYVKAALIVGGVAALYGQTLAEMAADWWNDSSLSQGLLIPPLSLYLAWLHRTRIASEPTVPDNRGIAAIAFAAFGFLAGKLAAEFFLMRISFVILLTGLVWTFWGKVRLRLLAASLILLATMVPLPVLVYNSMAVPLQLLASDAATSIAQMSGVSVYRDGNIIHLAHISLGVEEACSGLNSLSALLVASILIGFLLLRRTLPRVLIVAISIPLSIAVNILRIAGTAILADYHEEFASGFYHFFSGWLIFVIGFVGLYLLAMLFHLLFDGNNRSTTVAS